MSGSSSMADVATDLLNKAKLSTSAQEKLFSLEQIKEVIFHRDPTLFPAFLEEITDFVVDKTVTVRKFLASFGGETLSKFPLHTPAILKMFDFLIRDESDSVVRAVVSEMARHFGRCAMYVVGQDTRSAKSFFAKSSGQLSPKDQWELLTRFTKTVVELLSSSRSAALRVQCIHYMSSYLLFSLPLDTFSQGAQKRAKTEHSAGRFQSPFNAASISLHHAFLSKDQIEAEAKTVLTRLALWATRGGPQGAPFTDEQMGELGVALAGVALERPRECRAILPAVTVLVLALNAEKPLELPAELRTSFVELAGELSEGIVSANHDDVEKKLKDALKSLQDAHSNKPIATTGAALLSNLLNMNEEFSSEEDEPMDGAAAETGDDVDDDDNDVRIRNRAIAAINSFETTTNGLPLKDREFVGSVAVVETQAPEVRNTKDTVLADDAPAFPDPPHVGPLWVVVPIGGPGGDVGFKAAPSATQVTPDGYFNLSMSHLHSMLQNGLQGSIKSSEKGQLFVLNMAVRLVITLSLGELGGIYSHSVGSIQPRFKALSIFQNIRVTETEMLCDPPVPLQVSLPSVLVYVIGFCIRRLEEKEYTTSGLSRRAAASIEAAAVSRRIELLTAIACEIYERSRANAAAEANIVTFEYDIHAVGDIELNSAKNSSESPVDENDEMDLDNDDTLVPGTDLTLYDNLCLATFSRLFQRLQHRQKGAPDFLFNLPVIPDSILHVLKMLMYSGTLPDSGAENALLRRKRKRGSDASQMQDLGTRIASMELLSHICLIEPVDATNHTTVVALSQLLWATTSSDFKTRTNAINVIVSELVPNGAFLNDMITLFALQSSIIIAGSESVNERCADLRSFEKDEKEKLSECSALQSSSVEFVSVNIEDASLQFDDGLSHHGSFHESMVALTTLDGASIGDAAADPKVADTVDAIMRRHLHLLIQLCLLNPDMLESLFNLYGACAAILEKNPASSRHALACRIIRSEFCNILASLASSFSPEKVLDRVLCSDPLARKLVILTLETLFVGADNPCSTVLVAKVRLYAARYAIYEEYSKGRPDNTEVASIVDPALQLKLKFTELLVPVISGLTASEVVEQVPLIMMLCLRYGGDLEGTLGDASAEDAQNRLPSAESAMTALFHAFSRIVRPRPPPLSKSGLIIALHRLSAENDGVSDKEIQDAIGLCINRVNPQWDLDMKGSIIVEASLKLLLDDSMTPPVQIMRTLLLACRIMPEVMKFMLSEAIPRLARRRTWISAPRVWDGVLHAMKKYFSASLRDGVESLLRTILGLPPKQFNIVLQLCGPDIKVVLKTAVKNFSVTEQGEVLSGAWIGLKDENGSGAQEEKLKQIGFSSA